MSIVSTTDYMQQSATMTLHEIADRLWVHGEHEAYRAVLAYAKERSTMIKELKEPK